MIDVPVVVYEDGNRRSSIPVMEDIEVRPFSVYGMIQSVGRLNRKPKHCSRTGQVITTNLYVETGTFTWQFETPLYRIT